MLQQTDEEQLDALDGRRKGLCETRWLCQTVLKHTFSNNKSNHEAEILKGKFQLHNIAITTSP
jgi:hypothetical protein